VQKLSILGVVNVLFWDKKIKASFCLKNNSCLKYSGILQTTPTEDAG